MKHQDRNKRRGRRHSEPAASSALRGGPSPINSTKMAMLITFLKILVKGKIHYCEPRVDTMLALLLEYHGIDIKRRWFFQCLLDLELTGYIRRQRRWIKLPGPQIESISSLWWFTIRGAKFMCSKMIRGSQELLHSMLNWINRGDDRRPTTKDLAGLDPVTDQAEALKRIKQIIRDIG